eukprot:gnl/MRDRNA2_/MRDRNA2_71051_c0_seq1.p1 gnl/MRDRNA2_/MRDRNA2_71051_c0~~gnl/MRDRNA2_/MRDRNA2_71051_c0_seq1.p1  ORF type:complete len:397 (+),score=51.98 gnl/MRDRNA2_/MRDRNA2_71051_c0_seq1:68-1192(+)
MGDVQSFFVADCARGRQKSKAVNQIESCVSEPGERQQMGKGGKLNRRGTGRTASSGNGAVAPSKTDCQIASVPLGGRCKSRSLASGGAGRADSMDSQQAGSIFLGSARHKSVAHQKPYSPWNLRLFSDSPMLRHPDDPNDAEIFQCVMRRMPQGGSNLVGLLSSPPSSCPLVGLVLTCPGAGGGPGPADPMGGGGGGTYGAYNVFGKLAAELPRHGIAVLLLHYPEGHPGAHPRKGGISKTMEHAEHLIKWFCARVCSPALPIAVVGWSMGGAVAIDVAANGIRRKSMNIQGVATIASMKDVSKTSPGEIIESGARMLLLHNVDEQCNASNSYHIGKLAGIEPMLFPGENHGVKSAFGVLVQWLPSCLQPNAKE